MFPCVIRPHQTINDRKKRKRKRIPSVSISNWLSTEWKISGSDIAVFLVLCIARDARPVQFSSCSVNPGSLKVQRCISSNWSTRRKGQTKVVDWFIRPIRRSRRAVLTIGVADGTWRPREQCWQVSNPLVLYEVRWNTTINYHQLQVLD